jgi:hypothetical protein
LFITAREVEDAEILGYTGTRNPHAMDMERIILATDSSMEYWV